MAHEYSKPAGCIISPQRTFEISISNCRSEDPQASFTYVYTYILNSKGDAVNGNHPVSAVCADDQKGIRGITGRERIPNW